MITAVINKIIDSSVVDGPGNRTAVFFQGCNFNCAYCHNPETISHCSSCGKCIDSCPSRALNFKDGKPSWDSSLCIGCDKCLSACGRNSSPKTRVMTPEELTEHIKGNLPFIRGITLSGGECTLNPEFICRLFALTAGLGLENLMDTNGSLDFEAFPEILANCHGVMLDIKAFDDEEHRRLTGASSKLVLKNARFLAGIGKLAEIRTVVIPGVLDNEGTIDGVSRLLAPYVNQYDIHYRLIKYRPFGVRGNFRNLAVPEDVYMESLRDRAMRGGFKTVRII